MILPLALKANILYSPDIDACKDSVVYARTCLLREMISIAVNGHDHCTSLFGCGGDVNVRFYRISLITIQPSMVIY